MPAKIQPRRDTHPSPADYREGRVPSKHPSIETLPTPNYPKEPSLPVPTTSTTEPPTFSNTSTIYQPLQKRGNRTHISSTTPITWDPTMPTSSPPSSLHPSSQQREPPLPRTANREQATQVQDPPKPPRPINADEQAMQQKQRETKPRHSNFFFFPRVTDITIPPSKQKRKPRSNIPLPSIVLPTTTTTFPSSSSNITHTHTPLQMSWEPRTQDPNVLTHIPLSHLLPKSRQTPSSPRSSIREKIRGGHPRPSPRPKISRDSCLDITS